MKRIFIPLVLLLQGCATPYQPSGVSGGFSEMALANDVYIVSFRGNGFTSSDLVNAYLLRRGAELTKEKGYKYFVVLAGNQVVDSAQIRTPTTINTTGHGRSSYYGNQYGNRFDLDGEHSFNAETTINPGNSYNIDRYRSKMIIKMLKSNNFNNNALDADIILSNFKRY